MSGSGPLNTFRHSRSQGLESLESHREFSSCISCLSEIFRQTFYGHKLRKKEKSDHTFCINNHVKASCGMLFFTKIKSLKNHKNSELIEILGCVHRMTLQKKNLGKELQDEPVWSLVVYCERFKMRTDLVSMWLSTLCNMSRDATSPFCNPSPRTRPSPCCEPTPRWGTNTKSWDPGGKPGVEARCYPDPDLLRGARPRNKRPADSRSVVLFVKLRILHFVLEVKSL